MQKKHKFSVKGWLVECLKLTSSLEKKILIEKAGTNQKRKDCGLQVFFKVNQILEMNNLKNYQHFNWGLNYYGQSPGNHNKQLSLYVI